MTDRTDTADDVEQRLVALGMSAEDAAAAVAQDRVVLALLDHLLDGPRRFTLADAVSRTGLDVDTIRQIDRAAGVNSDTTRYSEADVATMELIGRLTRVLPTDALIDTVRGDIQALRTMGMRTLAMADTLLLRKALAASDDPIAAATAVAHAARPLLDISQELIGAAYRRVVLRLLSDEVVQQALRAGDETVAVAIGFVDVVGYTSLSARIDPTGLDEVLDAFEDRCRAAAEDTTGVVRLVKFLGDAAMFVSTDRVALARMLFDLVGEPPSGDSGTAVRTPMRGGMAAGRVLLRAADYFGDTVNEAARLTDIAHPGSVLVAESITDELRRAFHLKRLSPTYLRGLGVSHPAALRRLRQEESG